MMVSKSFSWDRERCPGPMCHHDRNPVVAEPTGSEGQRVRGLSVHPLRIVNGDEQRRTGRLGRQQAERRRAEQETIPGLDWRPPTERGRQRRRLRLREQSPGPLAGATGRTATPLPTTPPRTRRPVRFRHFQPSARSRLGDRVEQMCLAASALAPKDCQQPHCQAPRRDSRSASLASSVVATDNTRQTSSRLPLRGGHGWTLVMTPARTYGSTSTLDGSGAGTEIGRGRATVDVDAAPLLGAEACRVQHR